MNNIVLILILIFILQIVFQFFYKSSAPKTMTGGSGFIYNVNSCKKIIDELF